MHHPTWNAPLIVSLLYAMAGMGLSAMAGGQGVIAQDEAYYPEYRGGWLSGTSGGSGFGPWNLWAPDYSDQPNSYAGFFLAEAEREPDLAGAAREGRAFGIFANGEGFQETVASRELQQLLQPGQAFSFIMEFKQFEKKFETDVLGSASVGLALGTDMAGAVTAALADQRLFVFGAMNGLSTYQIVDADPRFNTRIFLDPEGVRVTFILKDGHHYDLQVQTLSDQKITTFRDRRLRSPAKADNDTPPRIDSFSLFNLNGGRYNLYFGSFQISSAPEAGPRES